MSNWYLYYRIMHATHVGANRARNEIQDVLVDLRNKAVAEWPGSTDQQIQDFSEYLSLNSRVLSQSELNNLTMQEVWQ